jgi:hypothetical protein
VTETVNRWSAATSPCWSYVGQVNQFYPKGNAACIPIPQEIGRLCRSLLHSHPCPSALSAVKTSLSIFASFSRFPRLKSPNPCLSVFIRG